MQFYRAKNSNSLINAHVFGIKLVIATSSYALRSQMQLQLLYPAAAAIRPTLNVAGDARNRSKSEDQ